jgi:hypothetical protein
MTCGELSTILAERPRASLPADLRAQVDAHLAECPGCRNLVESIEGIENMPVPQSLFSPEEIAPVRPMTSGALFVGLALGVTLVLMAAAVIWKGAFGWEAMDGSTSGLFVALAVAGLGALGLGFYRQFKPGARDTVDGRAALAVLAAGAIAFAAVEFPWHPQEAGNLELAWVCLRFGVMVALVTSAALLIWSRQGFAANPRSASFWTGALASLAGMIALGVHCPVLELSHILLGHVSVILVASLIIAWMARRFFGLR